MLISSVQQEVLSTLSTSVVPDLIQKHLAKRGKKIWMPSELLPRSRDDSAPEISSEYTGMLVLNLLTEDGLPYFLGLLMKHLGDEGALWEWTRIWTAEEDRHGAVIKRYLSHALNSAAMASIERQQHEYLEAGFWPDWSNDPYQLLAYVVLQEKATQVSHRGISRGVKDADPLLARVMGTVAGEEGRHHDFYFALFAEIVTIDPVRALDALYKVIKTFAMPGANMPSFADLAYIQMRRGVFGSLEFGNIIEDVVQKLSLAGRNDLPAEAEKIRDKIMRQPHVLERIAQNFDRMPKRTVPLPFLGTTVTL